MLSKVKSLFQDFLQLPLGFRAVSILVAGGGLVGMVWAFSLGGMILPILGIILALGVLFYLVGVLARFLAKRKGKGMGASLWALTDRKKDAGEAYATKAEVDAARKLKHRWKDVYQLLTEKGYDFYSLPWYLVIGPSQSGKTTLIQKSNQEFPIGDKPVADFGTKNCNWFFTNKAILIDTAGRYVEHHGQEGESPEGSEDKVEWEDFLSLLKRYRKRSPINGLILTVKIPDVLSPDPTQRERTAEMLRKALLDIEDRLKIQCPVYVMVCMCDLLTGFNEFFSLLPGLSDRSLLGWSQSGKYDARFDGSEMKQGLHDVTGLLRNLRLDFMNEKAGLAINDADEMKQLDKLYAFPDEFEAMLEPLQSILKKTFEPSTYYQGHFLRGTFFTSALQKGEPVLGACLNLLGTGGASLSSTDGALLGTSKSFFIADFFEEKVFVEKGLVKPTTRSSRDKKLKEVAAFTAGAALLLGTLGWVAVKGFNLSRTVTGASAALEEVQTEIAQTAPDALSSPERLPSALKKLHEDLSRLDEVTAWISTGEVNNTIDKGDFTIAQSFIYHCFRPALARFLAADRRAENWEDGIRSFETLATLHRLSLERVEAGGAGSGRLWTEDFKRVCLAIDVGGAQGMIGLVDQFPIGLEVMAKNEETRNYLSNMLRDDSCRYRIWRRLNRGVLEPWDSMLEQLHNSPEGTDGLWSDTSQESPAARAWTLDQLHCLEERFGATLVEMRQILDRIEQSDSWKNAVSYEEKISGPWKKQALKLRALLGAAESMTRSSDLFEETDQALKARHEQFQDLKKELRISLGPKDLTEEGGKVWRGVVDPLNDLIKKMARRNETIREWLGKKNPDRHILFEITDETITAAKDGGAEAATRQVKKIAIKELRQLRRELDALDKLVTCDIAADPVLNPANSEFWTQPTKLDVWLNGWLACLSEGNAGETSLLTAGKVSSLVEGFGNWMLLSFFRRIKGLCQLEQEVLVRGLGEVCQRTEKKKPTVRGPKLNFFRDEGYCYSRVAVETINTWMESIVTSFDRTRSGAGQTGEWKSHFGDLDFLSNTFTSYNSGFKTYWNSTVATALADYLERGDAPNAASGREAFDQLTTWPKGRSNSEFRSGLKQLIDTVGRQPGQSDWGRDTWVDKDSDYRLGYLFWERYADETVRSLLERAADDFIESCDFLAERSRELGEGKETDPRFRLLRFALEKKSGLMAFHGLKKELNKRKASHGGRVSAEGSFSDPLLDALTSHADRVRAALTRIGGELFEDQWTLVGRLAEEVTDTFPFQGRELPTDGDKKVRLADWQEAKAFLESGPFIDLAETVGSAHIDDEPLFSVEIKPTQRADCFRRCTQLSHFLVNAPDITARVVGIGAWRVSTPKWSFMVRRNADEILSVGFSAVALDSFDVAIPLDGEPYKIFLRYRKQPGDEKILGNWDSFHPLPPETQDGSPWNFLAWLWMWGRYDENEKLFTVTVRIPSKDKNMDVKNRTFDLYGWIDRLEESDVMTMELQIKMPPNFPDRAPDLRAAGWEER